MSFCELRVNISKMFGGMMHKFLHAYHVYPYTALRLDKMIPIKFKYMDEHI